MRRLLIGAIALAGCGGGGYAIEDAPAATVAPRTTEAPRTVDPEVQMLDLLWPDYRDVVCGAAADIYLTDTEIVYFFEHGVDGNSGYGEALSNEAREHLIDLVRSC
jgi:hypothetical protein